MPLNETSPMKISAYATGRKLILPSTSNLALAGIEFLWKSQNKKTKDIDF